MGTDSNCSSGSACSKSNFFSDGCSGSNCGTWSSQSAAVHCRHSKCSGLLHRKVKRSKENKNLTHKHILRAEVNHWDAWCIVRRREGGRGGMNDWIEWMAMERWGNRHQEYEHLCLHVNICIV